MAGARRVHQVDQDGVAVCGRFRVKDWADARFYRRRLTSAVSCKKCRDAHRAPNKGRNRAALAMPAPRAHSAGQL